MLRASSIWSNQGFGPTLMQAITTAGLTTNLQLCLDAGDIASYTGSGLKWLDVSGNGCDFFKGDDGTTHAPTFVGFPGDRGSYWFLNGSAFFRYDTTNETWMQNLHKNNAIFSYVALIYRNSSSPSLFGDSANGAGTGIHCANSRDINVFNGSSPVISKSGDTLLTSLAWNFVGGSLNEATGSGGGFHYLNGAYNQVGGADTFDSTYSSPSSLGALATLEIGAAGGGSEPSGSGTLLSCVAFWGGTALTKVNIDTLWASMRGRFHL